MRNENVAHSTAYLFINRAIWAWLLHGLSLANVRELVLFLANDIAGTDQLDVACKQERVVMFIFF